MNELLHGGQFKGHKAVAVGAGTSGLAAARLLCALGASTALLEKNAAAVGDAVRDAAETHGFAIRTGEHRPEDFAGANLVVLSPGVPKRSLEPFLAACPDAQVVAEMELASWFTREPILAVTGANGKTTTVMLAGHILSAAGYNAFIGGNIGTPLSEYVLSGDKADVLVLEASSFQLQNVHTFRPRVAVLLNFSPNHLDWHLDMDEYLEAKLNIFAKQRAGDTAILPESMRETLAGRDFTKARVAWFTPQGGFACERLPGAHNQANMEAAFLACREFDVSRESAQKAIADFKAPPHRLQPVGEKNGVLFVDDSKATTVEALRAALESLKRPVRLLAGGVFKGGDLKSLLPAMKGKVVKVGLFGGSRDVFEQAWADELNVFWAPDMRGAVDGLYEDAGEGDVILLSPATSSFDQYKSYKDRARDFHTIFGDLPGTPLTKNAEDSGNGDGGKG